LASLDSVKQRMWNLMEDPAVPENISDTVGSAVKELEGDNDLSLKANSAASLLEEVGNDPNIAQHIRTEVWNLASKVENLDGE